MDMTFGRHKNKPVALSGVTEEEIRSWYVPAAARSIASGAILEEQIAKLAAMIRNKLCLA